MTLRGGVAGLAARARGWHAGGTLVGGLGAALAAFAAVALLVGDARWLAWPRLVPFAAWGGTLAVVAVAARRLRRGRGDEFALPSIARTIEREAGLRAGSVLGALEVEAGGPLGALAASQVRARLPAPAAWAAGWQARWRLRAWRAAGLAAAGTGAAAVAAWRAPDGWAAAVHPVRAARGTLLPPPVLSAPALAVRGTAVTVGVTAPGRREVTVRWRAVGQPWRDTLLRPDAGGRAVLAAGRAEADIALVADDGRVRSDTLRIRVVERPYVGDLQLRAVYPAYLGREAEDLAPGDELRLPRGTRLAMRALASVPLATLGLSAGGDTVRFALGDDGTRASYTLVADRTRAWGWFAAVRTDGPTPEVPRPLVVTVLPDSAPDVAILSPSHDTTTTLGVTLPVTIAAQDDHGLASVRLVAWRLPADGGERPLGAQVLAVSPGGAWSGTLLLDAAARGLDPGDALRLVAEAVDASPWSQASRSRPLLVRVPALDEQRALARAAADTAASAAQRIAAAQRALERRTADAARERAAAVARGDRQMDFAQAEQARALAAEQRRAAERARDVAEQAASLERRLQQAGGLDSALAQRLREVQALLQEAMTPAMAERLRQLEAASRELSGERTAEQLAGLRQDQQRLREQLDRSAALLQRAALEGAMQTLKDEAAELASRERALADSLATGAADPARAEAARRLAERTARFAEDAERLQERLQRERAGPGADGARAAKQASQAASREMQEAGRTAGSAPKAAAEDAGAASAAMTEAARAMAAGRREQVEAWKRDVAEALDRAAQEMEQLAQQQGQLAKQAQAGSDASGMRGDQAAVQQGVEQAADRIGSTGRSSSLVSQRSQRAMAEAKRQVQEAMQQVREGRGSAAERAEAMRQAAQQLQQASQALARDRERVNRSETASGFAEFLEEMQRAAREQGQAAQQAQQLLGLSPSRQGERAELLRALARQQRQVARALDQAGADDATGRTDAMAREARQLADRLEQGGADRETLQRQQQLFRRLLDAGRSLEQREQDEQGRREARTGSGAMRAVAGRTTGTKALAADAAQLRALTTDERRLVGDYFRRLNATPR